MIRAQSLVSNDPVDWHREERSVWVDAQAPSPEELADLERVFPLNPLALDDALTRGQWSRFEAYPQHVFLVYRTPTASEAAFPAEPPAPEPPSPALPRITPPPGQDDGTERVSLFWYPASDTLLTLRLGPVDYLERVWREFDPLTRGSEEQAIYFLLAQGANTFFQFADALQERTDALEEEMFTSTKSAALATRIFAYKHRIMNVRRLASNAREAVASFSRHVLVVTNSRPDADGQLDPRAQESALYFRDVVDTLGRVYDTLDSAREVLSNILDVNLSVQQGRTNDVVKTLTTVSTIFLPLAFLAGVWGMNFAYIPELHWRYGYLFAWCSFGAVALGLAAYFKRRGWW